MRKSSIRQGLFLSSLALTLVAGPTVVASAPVPCAGGTLDIAASSDTPVTLPTFNVGQLVRLQAVASGFTPDSHAWTIEGPHIKDYEDRLGTTGTGPISWSTSALTAADLSAPTVEFYWKPSPSQIEPLNAGAVTRQVELEVTVGGTTCLNSGTFFVERNATDLTKQAVDFYTSNHRAPTETNPSKGRVIDDHIEWHTVPGTRLLDFLPWHGRFLARFDQWRLEFGYPKEVAWYPGTPLPAGVEMQHTPRLTSFDPDINRIPTWYTLAGGTVPAPNIGPIVGGQLRLADFSSLSSFSRHLEFSYHGQVHCDVGPGGFAAMCDFTSPKDPIFWRWHGFLDLMFRNFCDEKGLSCESGPDPATDVWMADNGADLANGGTPPSASPRWISPDVWNRSAPAACTPANPNPGGTRDCGSDADHENPVAGVENYLYATIHNDTGTASELVYAEVAVYVANASTGLSWPADFGAPLPETRQFITLNLPPGEVTDIGPLPWVPPSPTPSDHWCLYLRILTPQDLIDPTEVASLDTNTRDSNDVAWRNLNIIELAPFAEAVFTSFIVRNIHEEPAMIALQFETPGTLLEAGEVTVALDDRLRRRWQEAPGSLDGLEEGEEAFKIVGKRAVLEGLSLEPREEGSITLRTLARPGQVPDGAIQITQRSAGEEIDGGITLPVVLSARPSGELPDLVAKLNLPRRVTAGADVSDQITLTIANQGRGKAPGTLDANSDGYMVDLVLSSDETLPQGFATFSPTFEEDSLLRGGRVSRTLTLTPGQTTDARVGATIPKDTPPGTYCLGAVVDPGTRIPELDEANNSACFEIEVVRG
jgi:Common central domain of tyrosinase/CARDB